MRYIIIYFILLATSLFAQVEQSQNSNPYSFLPAFNIDIANYKGSIEGKTKVDIFLQVPYSNIQFVKSGDSYSAKYSVSITFYDENKENVIIERLWYEKVNVINFSHTSSKLNYNISHRAFDLTPGKYQLVCQFEDQDSKKNFLYETNTRVLEFNNEIDISDLIFISKTISDKNGEKILPNISKIITSNQEKLAFFFEIYTDKEDDILIEYQIVDKKRAKTFSQQQLTNLSVGKNTINHTIDKVDLSLGEYDLIVQLKDETGKVIKAIGKTFHSKLYGFPNSIIDIDNAIEQMLYIASNDDIQKIKSSDGYEQKLKDFINFWKSKDPSPNTVENEVLSEYYRRVDYANEHFESYFPGWRTDMGMVYITIGPPDQVERHPFEYDSKPYEIWDYFDLNKRFVFIDQTGFGDYRLSDPQYGEWNRYRY